MAGNMILGYAAHSSTTYGGSANSPTNDQDWHLLSFINANKDYGSQLATGDGGICYRKRYGGNWGSWNHLNVKCT